MDWKLSACTGWNLFLRVAFPSPGTYDELLPFRISLDKFRIGFLEIDRDLLSSQARVLSSKYRKSGLQMCANPHGARPTHKREGVVTDELRGTGKFEGYRIAGDRPNAAKLICYAQDDTRAVGTIGGQFEVVGDDMELPIRSATGKRL